VTLYTNVALTDYAGRARWQVPAQPVGNYTLKAWLGLPVSTELGPEQPVLRRLQRHGTLVVGNLNFSVSSLQ